MKAPPGTVRADLTYDNAVAVALQSNPRLRRTHWPSSASAVPTSPKPACRRTPPSDSASAPQIDGMSGAPAMVQGMQMLSWLWKNPHRVDAAEAELKAAVFSAAETCVDLMARTRTQVAAVLAGQQLLAFDQEHAAIAEHTLTLVRQQVRSGRTG